MKRNKIIITITDTEEDTATVKVVFNGKEGISAAEEETPALIFAFAALDAMKAEAEHSKG